MPTIRNIVVTGGRKFADYGRIEADLRALKEQGAARLSTGANAVAKDRRPDSARPLAANGPVRPTRSADALADHAAIALGLDVGRYHADWNRLGKSAGHRRNTAMLEAERPDLVLAYPDVESRGTWHCVTEALRLAHPVALWVPWPEPRIPIAPSVFASIAHVSGPRFVLMPHGNEDGAGKAMRVLDLLG